MWREIDGSMKLIVYFLYNMQHKIKHNKFFSPFSTNYSGNLKRNTYSPIWFL